MLISEGAISNLEKREQSNEVGRGIAGK